MTNNNYSNDYWVKAMETANYLQNKLPIKRKNYRKMISENSWTKKEQSLQYIHIVDSLALSHIPDEKRKKSDY